MLQSDLRLVTRTPFSFFDQGCSYLALWLPMKHRYQNAIQKITNVTLESKVKVTHI